MLYALTQYVRTAVPFVYEQQYLSHKSKKLNIKNSSM